MNDQQQHSTAAEVHLTAEQDAESDAKKIRWFFIGLFGNILGILIASIYEPTPPLHGCLRNHLNMQPCIQIVTKQKADAFKPGCPQLA